MTAPTRPLLLSFALVLALAACKKEEQQAPPPPEVGVIDMQPTSVPLTRALSGRLAPVRSADVRARVPGVLLKRVYEEGTDVKEGQVLFKIDPAPLQADLSSAQGQQASAQATYTNAHIAAQRARKLAPQQYVSQSDLDDAEAAERSAAAALQQAKAAVTNAQINLGYANVTAPISGRAGKQQVTEGALVGAEGVTLLTTVDQIDPLYVNFTMSSSELQSLRQAQGQGSVSLSDTRDTKVKIKLPTGQVYDQVGTLDFSDVVVDQATGAVSLRATVPNPDKALLPGSFVTVDADLGTRSGVFLVPQEAIQRDTNGAYAMVVGADGKVARKDVQMETAPVDRKWVVTDGLKTGDRVIGIGLQKAKEGGQVKAVPYEQAKAAAQQGAAGQGQQPPAAGADAKQGDAQKPAQDQAK
ncbi:MULTISPECIES: efflux RND transporter periplasmic adaptor subunit [Pseudoxanthomonas]|jgi:membrane fusion protein (multidrug efflux system)|uniref:Efflux RND transporter periplasmic adaptor subunit n=1 Tax=Pseudoxanthomonas winnipegensis TaxID=2480810 RepID=A0A4Q8L7U9_9GAMM|nr:MULTISPECIES: efflux RND transporter periplasmic adaptor subunit [Pseudoxanthomonas]PZP63057.1 MAG: efflux transporter periplasmic adaptor subunit [Pseudoxanthomonas spadix]TAA23676.1 efflux RND transporter periplasmic adaptor subunit [Pseudoxanthomonas winnipegensis]TMN25894.1 efflux RND transporter periplasmic adaptor subunit [Pseudoxanthomonas sp. X-1]UAY76506.1 efflux RND transporter periplasmic adaptor subunit [Pseudoxanthomonas sp. X-1]